ncbi:MAG TPA: acyloxyacyl hydrolase, partial [Sphingobacteriaceae bacterium]
DDISIVAGYQDMSQISIRDSADSRGFLKQTYTLAAKMNNTLFERNRLSLALSTGLGVTASHTSYFTDHNPLVGSRLNFFLSTGLRAKGRVSETVSLVSSVNLGHYSNASIRVPNNGVNVIQGSLGVIYNLPAQERKERKPAKSDSADRFFELAADIGRRGAWRSTAGNWKSGFSLTYNQKLNPVVSLKGGVDAVYYFSPFDGTGETYQSYATSLTRWRSGIGAGFDVWMGRLTTGAAYGYYVQYKSYHDVRAYWNAGMKYYITPGLGVQYKAYFHRLHCDYIGVGVVVRR